MKATTRSPHALAMLTLGAMALLLAACGGDQQTHAQAPPPPPPVETSPVGATNLQASPGSVPPNTPTASTISVSADILQACNLPDKDAYFAFDSSGLTSFDQAPLDAVATCFSSGPMAGHKLNLVGHADPRGTADYNVTLGQARADSVATFLTTHGMLNRNVTSTSRGSMDATGRDETGWAHDRRVDVSRGD
ncbi:MAG: OmpA family protein [Polyangiaceae bacterium]|jgi:peptidoglycan-associated lipoprotein